MYNWCKSYILEYLEETHVPAYFSLKHMKWFHFLDPLRLATFHINSLNLVFGISKGWTIMQWHLLEDWEIQVSRIKRWKDIKGKLDFLQSSTRSYVSVTFSFVIRCECLIIACFRGVWSSWNNLETLNFSIVCCHFQK